MRCIYLLIGALAASGMAAPQVASKNYAFSAASIGDHALKSRANGDYKCHTKKDSIGNYCWLFDTNIFLIAIKYYCRYQFAIPVVSDFGKSYPLYIEDVPDGKGHNQKMWGNIRVDRASNGAIDKNKKVLTYSTCVADLKAVQGDCGGYGGWVTQDYGTSFAECIRV